MNSPDTSLASFLQSKHFIGQRKQHFDYNNVPVFKLLTKLTLDLKHLRDGIFKFKCSSQDQLNQFFKSVKHSGIVSSMSQLNQ